jgi:S-formylglutathione hydrolase FrmB
MKANTIGQLPRWLAFIALVFGIAASTASVAAPVVLHVTLQGGIDGPASGRLLIFARAVTSPGDAAATSVDAGTADPRSVAVAAREVRDLRPGETMDIDADVTAFPQGFSTLPAGRYLAQAVLDRRHTYAYDGRGEGDIIGPVAQIDLPAGGALTLDRALGAADPWSLPADASPDRTAQVAHARAATTPIDFDSPALGRFWGRPVHIKGWVLTPPGYDPRSARRYPTVYFTHGFGGTARRLVGTVIVVDHAMDVGDMPPMIWVFLDESGPTGTHEFADGVNNGPWGEALTGELIPALERRWRMDARPSGRFLNGHSSGGWATLWLQTRYPALFGGTWSTSPDPSDFHDFTGIDLYAPGANVYRKADGSPWPLVRDHGRVLATFQDYAQLEAVLGDYGGQISSFDWVFSPRGEDGRPIPMFDRVTGAVDPAVVAYWRDHYDIAWRLAHQWPALKPDLDGKIHLIVGAADTFYLDGAAHRLQAVLDGLGAKSDFRFLPGRTHMDLYRIDNDPRGLLKAIAWEMYAIARPAEARPPAPAGQSNSPSQP